MEWKMLWPAYSLDQLREPTPMTTSIVKAMKPLLINVGMKMTAIAQRIVGLEFIVYKLTYSSSSD
jgi:hypothetical protein